MKSALHALALLGWCAWLAFEYLAFGPASYIRQHDTAEVNTPFYTALPELDERRLTGWWDPLAGTGVDALSNLKGDMPVVEALFRYAPHWSNSGILLLVQSLVAAVGTFVLLRRRMQVDAAPALLAAAWFAFLPWVSLPHSGFPTWYGWYVSGFPLAVYALGTCGELRGGRGTVPAAAIGAVLALGTPTASGMLVVPVALLWVLAFAEPAHRRACVLPLVCFALSFIVVKTPAIAALLWSVPSSHRIVRLAAAHQDGALDLWSRWEDVRAIVVAHSPLIVVGLSGLVAAGFRNRTLNVALGGMAALLGLSAATPLLQPLLALAGESFRTYQIDRVTRFFPFVAAVASALSLQHLRHVTRPFATAVRTAAWTAMLGSLVAASVWMNAGREAKRIGGDRYDAFFEEPILRKLAAEQRAGLPFRVATLADRNAGAHGRHAAFAWAYGLETADLYVTTYPLRYHEFWSRVIAPVRDRRPDIRAYFETWGSMAYLFNPAAPLFGPASATDLPPLDGFPFDLELLSLANVRYVLSAMPIRDERLTLRPDSRGVLVYENAGVLPRFFVTHRVRAFADEADLLAALAEASVRELRSTSFIAGGPSEERAGGSPTATGMDASVRVRDYSADKIQLEVVTPAAGILVITNSFSPFWRATIDGTPAAVFPVDYAFQGIVVPAGAHGVELRYRPPYSFGGAAQPLLLAALVAVVGAVGTWVARRV
jgi:hypothetical protein